MKFKTKIISTIATAVIAALVFTACTTSSSTDIPNNVETTIAQTENTTITTAVYQEQTTKKEVSTEVATTVVSPETTTKLANDRYDNGNEDINAANIDRMQQGDIRDGDVLEKGDYIYTYYSSQNGWSVEAADKTKKTYGDIKNQLYNIPVVSMQGCFYKCNNMVSAPKIPENVVNMESCFSECKNLSGNIIIPENVNNLSYCFFAASDTIDTIEIHSKNITKATNIFSDCSPDVIKAYENSTTFNTLLKNVNSSFSAFMIPF